MMERTPAEETPEGNKKTSVVLSDGALGNTCVCFCTMCVSEEMDYILYANKGNALQGDVS